MENVTLKIHHGNKWIDEAKEFNKELDDISRSRPSSHMDIIRMVGVPVKFLLLRDGVQTEHPIPAGNEEFRELNGVIKNLAIGHDLERSLRAMTIYHHVKPTTRILVFPHAEALANWQIENCVKMQPVNRSLIFLYDDEPAPMESDRYVRETITMTYAS